MVLNFSKTTPWGDPTNFEQLILSGEKIHTIRKGNRWSSGDFIHMSTGSRTPNYNQFNADRKDLQICKSVQEISIHYQPGVEFPVIEVDGVILGFIRSRLLAVNDGFKDEEYLYSWFKEDFKGQIIHWTDYRY